MFLAVLVMLATSTQKAHRHEVAVLDLEIAGGLSRDVALAGAIAGAQGLTVAARGAF